MTFNEIVHLIQLRAQLRDKTINFELSSAQLAKLASSAEHIYNIDSFFRMYSAQFNYF